MRPIELRLKKFPNGIRVTKVFEGVGNTSNTIIRPPINWRDWIKNQGWLTVPRIWE